MSDDEEYEYEYGSDADYDYGSDQDCAEGDGGNDITIEIENSFYGMLTEVAIVLLGLNQISHFLEGDDLKGEDPERAIDMFEKVVTMETEHGDQVKW